MNTTYTGELDDSKPSFTFQASCSNAYPENSNNLAYDLLGMGVFVLLVRPEFLDMMVEILIGL